MNRDKDYHRIHHKSTRARRVFHEPVTLASQYFQATDHIRDIVANREMMIDGDQIRDECKCMTPPFNYLDFETESIGVDETNGRFGEVTVDTGKACGTKWLRYFVEFESFSESGRWYCGLLHPEVIATITPETALEAINSLPWHFYGGSYFRTTGARSAGSGSISI